jgi:hypothetical protein
MPKKVYKKKDSNQFFTKNGKTLKSYKDFNSVFSLQELQENDEKVAESVQKEKKTETNKLQELRETLLGQKENLLKKAKEFRENAKKVNKLKLSMVSLGVNAALLIAVVFMVARGDSTSKYSPRYSIFSSKPLTSLAASTNLFGGDTRAATLDKIFEAYNCPLQGLGSTFVKEADKNEIPYWLVAAISFQESSCGKNTPQIKADGQEDVTDPDDLKFEESYNAWGWGVWGNNVKTFDNWEHGIASVSRYLGNTFYSQGITDTCVIMKTYTPPSDGSWCRGVNYFGDMIQNYTSPEN